MKAHCIKLRYYTPQPSPRVTSDAVRPYIGACALDLGQVLGSSAFTRVHETPMSDYLNSSLSMLSASGKEARRPTSRQLPCFLDTSLSSGPFASFTCPMSLSSNLCLLNLIKAYSRHSETRNYWETRSTRNIWIPVAFFYSFQACPSV